MNAQLLPQLICMIIEAAYRAGIKNGLERCAVVVDNDMRIGDQPLNQVLARVDGEALDCYTIVARNAPLARLMDQLKKAPK
jgi:hypothetical protein